MKKRENWGSKLGFIMAAAGSAIGLGNIWKFPYMIGKGGGGAFVIIYLIFVVLIGFSVMLTEFTIGRRSHLSAVGAFKTIDKRWTFAGTLGVLSGFLIMGFYPVVGGWAIAYMFKVATGLLSNPAAIGDTFETFITSTTTPLVWMAIFLILNILIVVKGISSGIEKASKVLMPALFGILIIIAIKGLTLPGAMAGIEFLFKPNFSHVNGTVILSALGQAFFSLSLGMGCMITYGSYLDKQQHLAQNAGIVVTMDTLFALLAGVAMFPAMFAFGMQPDQGPGLVFVVVPSLFAKMGAAGPIFGILFFLALTVAALTSSVSLLEVVTSYLMDEKNVDRKKAVISSSIVMCILCIIASLSLGGVGPTVFGTGAFDVFDLLTDKIFLSIGGLLVCVFAGWRLKKEDLYNEITNHGQVKFSLFNLWYSLVKYIIPITIAIVAFSGIQSGFEKGAGPVMIIGILIIFIFGLFSKKL